MNKDRKISKILKGKPTIEGAGVHLKRVFGYYEVPLLDPFLLLDDFHSDNPEDYIAGFPWHPHRGIETVTYMIHGKVKHEDSMGNSGVIQNGDVQWMTAGSGIIHSEMPVQDNGLLWGFQLWVNLPSPNKMMEPRYQDIQSEQIQEVSLDKGIKIKVVCGKIQDNAGPVQDLVIDPSYFDIILAPHTSFTHHVKNDYTVFAYVLEGNGYFDGDMDRLMSEEHLILYTDGEILKITSGEKAVRFLLIAGKPIGEPVAWHGPIVMNTQEELNLAFEEYRNGTFIKNK